MRKKTEWLSCVGAVQKHKARKPIRIRKGARIKGITVVDSETKKKVKKLLKAEAGMKMDVDSAVKTRKPLLKGAVVKKMTSNVHRKSDAATEKLIEEMVLG
ncbi:hypothetical protein CEUSTIGMA_g13566.t1 [Chlamydomonas eustigma]|uniref:Uncharacterized protein n=1 Tax=Chlamydomonas eustigma TaxID=1157962 RepID=A0A250XT15_9CHLO|nr:hypothetical protein CEUSTIGMA_g9445.t1 [Chlamydomonas eustigma]GAX86153.1 hypothetical protein CEUSTIGMA_g13566.t1 [Chlamydomonas eustigma]|eukprot:GAX82017.1 hypothetical protein CEUSTIGMA_g9445.t1 [Chlamydomonas eustigma]